MITELNEKDAILASIRDYINKKNKSKKWIAGEDWVQYAGPFFDENEYISSVETLLDGWLVLGKKGNTFENKFPPLMGILRLL